jgi:maltose alpha-D-glucosyltransferase/alpha-amylase
MVTPEVRQWMWEQYAPEPRMRLNAGIRRRLLPLLGHDKQQWVLLHALFLSLPGIPIIYYGDEIGMGDNIWLPDRHGCRTPMQWDSTTNSGFSTAVKTYLPVNEDYPQTNVAAQEGDPNSYLNLMRFLLKTRQNHAALQCGEFEFVETGSDRSSATAVLAYTRHLQGTRILCLFNLSNKPQTLPKEFLKPMQPTRDLLHPKKRIEDHVRVCDNEPNLLELLPHAAHWLVNE